GAAMLALAEVFVAVELLKERRQVAHNASQFDLCAMQEIVTILAVPLETVRFVLRPWHLDHHTHGSRLQSLWRMSHVLGQQENFSFLDWHFDRRFSWSLDEPQKDVALQLVEELLGRIIVIIPPVVGTANHGHHHLSIFPHLRVAHGW